MPSILRFRKHLTSNISTYLLPLKGRKITWITAGPLVKQRSLGIEFQEAEFGWTQLWDSYSPALSSACSYRKSCMVPGSPLCFLIEPHTERKHNTDFSLEPGPPGTPGCRLPIWGFWAPVYMWLTWPYADHSLTQQQSWDRAEPGGTGKETREKRLLVLCQP